MAEINKDLKNEEPGEFCKIKMNYLTQLKDSTRKLLCIIDEIQAKSPPAKPIPNQYEYNVPKLPPIQCPSKIQDLLDTTAIKKLEDQAKNLGNACIEIVDDDCSVFKRLTGKCTCLNRKEFNDFIMLFNENSKYNTSNLGEIIKNVRILKKFLYIGGNYSNNALMFLNEGFTRCPHSEKVEMMTACSHADICNVFDDNSFVRVFLMWPNKYESFVNDVTQMLAARVLYRLAVIEEGRRYLNFNSKITNDIKIVLRKKSSDLNTEILEFLNSTMNLLSPSIAPYINATYYCKADEGMTKKILNSLKHFRIYMTTDEVLHTLDLLHKLSETVNGRKELRQYLETIFNVFKLVLFEHDNTEMNVLMTCTLNNLMSRPKYEMYKIPSTTYMICDMSTEPIPVKHALLQMPSDRNLKKVRCKIGAEIKYIKQREPSKVRRRAGDVAANKNFMKARQKLNTEDVESDKKNIKTTEKPNTGDMEVNDKNTKTAENSTPKMHSIIGLKGDTNNGKFSQKPINKFREVSQKSFKEASKKKFREASQKSFREASKRSFKVFKKYTRKHIEASNTSIKVLEDSNHKLSLEDLISSEEENVDNQNPQS